LESPVSRFRFNNFRVMRQQRERMTENASLRAWSLEMLFSKESPRQVSFEQEHFLQAMESPK